MLKTRFQAWCTTDLILSKQNRTWSSNKIPLPKPETQIHEKKFFLKPVTLQSSENNSNVTNKMLQKHRDFTITRSQAVH